MAPRSDDAVTQEAERVPLLQEQAGETESTHQGAGACQPSCADVVLAPALVEQGIAAPTPTPQHSVPAAAQSHNEQERDSVPHVQPAVGPPQWPPVQAPRYGQHNRAPISPAELTALETFMETALQLPGLAHEWELMRPMLVSYLISSVLNLVVFSMIADSAGSTFLLAQLSAVLGILATVTTTVPSCRGNTDLVTQMKQLWALGLISLILDLFTILVADMALLLFAADCQPGQEQVCAMAMTAAMLFTLLLSCHGLLALQASKAAQHMIMHLNPITGGALSLD